MIKKREERRGGTLTRGTRSSIGAKEKKEKKINGEKKNSIVCKSNQERTTKRRR